ncbi:hypothetical protein VTN00DRAFT_1566 [Thermoascus crustaceus]|uniref:uncharacterized protein n=1 Tax=Thermoascus crustaceus TaxID=5088 RepID=UPI003742B158
MSAEIVIGIIGLLVALPPSLLVIWRTVRPIKQHLANLRDSYPNQVQMPHALSMPIPMPLLNRQGINNTLWETRLEDGLFSNDISLETGTGTRETLIHRSTIHTLSRTRVMSRQQVHVHAWTPLPSLHFAQEDRMDLRSSSVT